MKTLLLLRHGKSDWDNGAQTDRERPLKKRGRRDAPRMGDLLVAENLVPDLIVSSNATRARTTAELVADACGYERDLVLTDRLYHATAAEILAVVAEHAGEAERVLAVGHNPGMETLTRLFSDAWEPFPTCALACLHVEIENWSELVLDSPARLAGMWRPREL